MYLHQVCILFSISALCALGQEHLPLTLNEESGMQMVECKEFKYYAVEVTDPCKDLRVRVRRFEGEPNLYVSRGDTKFPTESSLAWTSYQWGSDELNISSWEPEFETGTFYIGVHAYCGDDVSTGFTPAKFTVLAESVETTHPHSEITADSPVEDVRVDAESYNYYRFCVPRKCLNVEVKLENCIDPTVCPNDYAYPELLVSRSILRPTIRDHAWKLADVVRRSIYLKHNDPEVRPGHHYVAVYGWCTPDEFCDDRTVCGPCDYVPLNDYSVSVIMTEAAGCDPNANDMAAITAPLSLSVLLCFAIMSFII